MKKQYKKQEKINRKRKQKSESCYKEIVSKNQWLTTLETLTISELLKKECIPSQVMLERPIVVVMLLRRLLTEPSKPKRM